MDIFLALFTYFAYVFILVAYAAKVVKYVRMPIHLRWELFTSIKAAKQFRHEDLATVSKQQAEAQSSEWRMSKVWSFMKEYLWFYSYLSHNKVYWGFLYVAHIGFVGLIVFQLLCIATAVGTFMVYDQPINAVDKATDSLVVLRVFLAIISFAAAII